MTGGYQPREVAGAIAQPPQNPSGSVPYSELLRKMVLLRAHRGDVLVLPAETSVEQAEELFKALCTILAGPPMVVIGPVQLLDETTMNAAGWYRA